jgi:hypothetical protein
METEHSDVGYPEEQPEPVHDETTKPEKDRKDKDTKQPPPDDGKATGNPRN